MMMTPREHQEMGKVKQKALDAYSFSGIAQLLLIISSHFSLS